MEEERNGRKESRGKEGTERRLKGERKGKKRKKGRRI